MNAERLLAKLELEADHASVQRLQNVRSQTQPATRAQQCRKTLNHLRAGTAQIEEELDLRQQVEREQERFSKAERVLRQKNLTLEERKEQEEDTRQFQTLLWRVTSPEQHPDWRIQAAETFRTRKL